MRDGEPDHGEGDHGMKASVLTPVHNTPIELLERAYRSLKSQSFGFADIQWVVVLHNCAPEYVRCVKALLGEQPNISLSEVSREGTGVSFARNATLAAAEGEYLFFLDSVDILPRAALEKMYAVGHGCDKDIVTSNVVRFDGSGEIKSRLHEIAFRSFGVDTDVYSNNSLLFDHTATNKLIRREFWEKVGFPFPENMFYEYIPTMIIMYCSTRKVGLIHDVCYQWRIRGGEKKSVTQSRTNYSNLKDRLKAMKIVDEYFDENIDNQNLKEVKEYKWAYTDLKIFINQCVNMEREDFANHLALIQAYVEENISDMIIEQLPVIHKEMYKAVKNGDIDRLRGLRELEMNGVYDALTITEEDNRTEIKYHDTSREENAARITLEVRVWSKNKTDPKREARRLFNVVDKN